MQGFVLLGLRLPLDLFGIVGISVAVPVELLHERLHPGRLAREPAREARADVEQVLAQLLRLVEGPLVVRFRA